MKARFLIPLGIFCALVVLFWVGLDLDPREVPSPLIGKPAPQFSVPELRQPEVTFGTADLTKEPVSLFNVWASWCVACREEHPLLMELSRTTDVPIYGLNYKDERADALGWLGSFGDPYRAVAFDREGNVGIDWGVYGVPETFVVDSHGVVRYKHIGPITPDAWQQKIEPEIRRIRQEAKS